MLDKLNKPAIKSFVKGTLGCSCPDRVFNEIKYEVSAILPHCQNPILRIELGDRLLIYLLVTDSPDVVECDLPVIIGSGKEERDRRGFNRFRAVVCTSNVGAVVHLAGDVFARHAQQDDMVHLHVVTREDAQAMLEPTFRD